LGAMRNFGATHAKGLVLVFLDADVTLTPEWRERIAEANRAAISSRLITGSWYSVPKDAGWIEKNWFDPLSRHDPTHMNSGHMLIPRALFQELRGFDESLVTGEDYEFSIRATKSGVHIVNDARLKVIHHGFPKTLGSFFKREIWHGAGDWASLATAARSKVAWTSLTVLGLHVSLITALIARSAMGVGASMIAISALCLAASVARFRRFGARTVLADAVVYYAYFIARGWSGLRAVLLGQRGARRTHR
jgi:GT2 family glycosyltransferase